MYMYQRDMHMYQTCTCACACACAKHLESRHSPLVQAGGGGGSTTGRYPSRRRLDKVRYIWAFACTGMYGYLHYHYTQGHTRSHSFVYGHRAGAGTAAISTGTTTTTRTTHCAACAPMKPSRGRIGRWSATRTAGALRARARALTESEPNPKSESGSEIKARVWPYSPDQPRTFT